MKKCFFYFLLGFCLLLSFIAKADWTEQEILVPGDGEDRDYFGKSVAIDGRYAVVGDPWNDQTAGNAGAVFVYYQNDSNEWVKQARLLASDGAVGDYFGQSVSISGDYIIVGACYDDHGAADGPGSAYIFKRSGETWTQQAKLTASDFGNDNFFGWSVGISADYAVIGAVGDDDSGGDYSGSAYVFERSGETWSQVNKLLASDGADNDRFGESVAISGDWLIVGSKEDDDGASNTGSVYFFKRVEGSWTQMVKVLASDAAADDEFGQAVSISGDYAIVGARWNDDGGSMSGSAYIIKRSGDSWTEQTKIVADDDASGDLFGYSVAISGDNALIGAMLDDDGGSSSGSAYLFTRSGDSWSQADKFTASDAAASSYFGTSVAITELSAVIGSVYESMGDPTGKKTAYLFSMYTEPVAAANDDLGEEVANETELTISGSCTDADGQTQTGWFSQTVGTDCGLTGDIVTSKNTGATPLDIEVTCIPDISSTEELTFQLNCTDNVVVTTDTISVTINAAPVAANQSTTALSGEAKNIILQGSDPDDDDINYTILSETSHGSLVGTAPNMTYVSSSGYEGADSFTYKVSDAYQSSNTATVSIIVTLNNHAPEINEDSDDYNITYTFGEDYNLPEWDITDEDDDDITSFWNQISGPSTLFITDNIIDTTNLHPKRGTYYFNLIASDGAALTTSTTIKLNLPNNPPLIDETDIEIPYSYFDDGVFVFDTFKKTTTIQAPFTDYDSDTLTYTWETNEDDEDLIELTAENDEATLIIRKTGEITISVTATDNQGGETTHDIIIDQPEPTLSFEDMAFTVLTQTLNSDGTQNITGELQAPFKPSIVINDVEATVTLESESPMLTKTLFLTDTTDYDTYSFVVANVESENSNSQLMVSVGNETAGETEYFVTNEPVNVTSNYAIGAGRGCALNVLQQTTNNSFFIYFLFMVFVLVLLRRAQNRST